MYATDDGARSWTPLDLPTREQPVRVALGGGAGYVLTSNCLRAGAACDHATVWSIDPTGAHPAHTFDSLPAKTHTNGGITLAGYGTSTWVFLDMGTGEPAAFHSVDGGRTWQRFPTELCLSEMPTATSSSVLWSTCATGMLEHFTRQIGQSKPVQVFRADIAGTSNSALLPISDTTAYAVIDDRHGTRVEATGDGGHTTSTVGSIPHPIMRRDFRTTFVSPEVGYLVTLTGGQLYRTTDGAHTWHKISPRTQ